MRAHSSKSSARRVRGDCVSVQPERRGQRRWLCMGFAITPVAHHGELIAVYAKLAQKMRTNAADGRRFTGDPSVEAVVGWRRTVP
jgi:hypothetical protein